MRPIIYHLLCKLLELMIHLWVAVNWRVEAQDRVRIQLCLSRLYGHEDIDNVVTAVNIFWTRG